MVTKIIKIDPDNPDKEALKEACEILKSGGLVAFPTETVYGLGGDAKNRYASEKIYAAKGRPSDNPLIVHIHDFSELEEIAANVPDSARKLADRFWPGPLTMILPKNNVIPLETTGGLDTVAVRMPSHPVARALLTLSNVMVAAPSANTSGRPSPTLAEHVEEDLSGKIDCIIDGGPVNIGLESTIVDLSSPVPTILRPGYINKAMLEEVLGEVNIDPAILDSNANKNIRPKAPGMRYRHYAPKGDLTVVEGDESVVIKKINDLVEKDKKDGKKTGVIATVETKDMYHCDNVLVAGDRNDEYTIAHNLYDVLRKFDELGTEKMYSESFETPKIGMAIMNRLLKAAGHRVIHAEDNKSVLRLQDFRRVIFAAGNGICRAPMAAGILIKLLPENSPVEVLSRGLVVQFPEPLNQKSEAVMASNGISFEGFESRELLNEEISDKTIVITMDEKQRKFILDKYPSANENNTRVLAQMAGEELETMDPYGGSLAKYGLCFEAMKTSLQKVLSSGEE